MQAAHAENFVSCIRSRQRPSADIEEGHISAALGHMANISYRVGNRKLQFDPAKEAFMEDKEANKYLRRTYRTRGSSGRIRSGTTWVLSDTK
jgi:hypothetical protein